MRTPFRLNRQEKQSWFVHKKIAVGFDWPSYLEAKDSLCQRVEEMKRENRNEEEEKLLFLWETYLENNDLAAIRRALVGVDEQSIALRKVSPFPTILDNS